MNTVVATRERENMSLQRQKEELISERDGLNWTLEVVLEHEQFPVGSYCPENGEITHDTEPGRGAAVQNNDLVLQEPANLVWTNGFGSSPTVTCFQEAPIRPRGKPGSKVKANVKPSRQTCW